jgi:hypothetical protein
MRLSPLSSGGVVLSSVQRDLQARHHDNIKAAVKTPFVRRASMTASMDASVAPNASHRQALKHRKGARRCRQVRDGDIPLVRNRIYDIMTD